MLHKPSTCVLICAAALTASTSLVESSGGKSAGGHSIRLVRLTIEREPDGKKYPTQVKETYTLERDGVLRYSAYFGGMPMDMNHNDSMDWKTGDLGKRVLETALRLVGKPGLGLKELRDDTPSPDEGTGGVYLVGLTTNGADSTQYVKDRKSSAWAALDGVFQAMIANFERDTGRPRKPDELPQHPATLATALPPPKKAGADDAILQVLPVVNAALDRAYAEFARRPGAVAPMHTGGWVTAEQAQTRGDAKRGLTLTWSLHRPAGFEFEATVKVSPSGAVQVVKAEASYSPD